MYEHILRIHVEVFSVIVLKQQPVFVKIIVYAALVVGLFVCVQMNKFAINIDNFMTETTNFH